MAGNSDKASTDRLIGRAKAGDQIAWDQLMSRYRNYLGLLGRLNSDRRLQAKIDASDLVQEACLRVAHRDFPGFRGTSQGEFVVWLRQIMASQRLQSFRQYFGTEQRNVKVEQRLQDQFDQSSTAMLHLLDGDGPSPSQNAAERERAVLLADALASLSVDYREVVILHHFQGLTMPEIAAQMGRSVPSVQKLWSRGIIRLRDQLKGML